MDIAFKLEFNQTWIFRVPSSLLPNWWLMVYLRLAFLIFNENLKNAYDTNTESRSILSVKSFASIMTF